MLTTLTVTRYYFCGFLMFSFMSLLFLEIVFLEFFSVIKSLLFPLNCVRRNHSKRYSFDKIFWKKLDFFYVYRSSRPEVVPDDCNFIKMRLWHRCFPVNFAKLLRISFLTEHLRWLILYLWFYLWKSSLEKLLIT